MVLPGEKECRGGWKIAAWEGEGVAIASVLMVRVKLH